MKISMQLTLDGMVRALRLRAHQLGEDRDETLRLRAAESNGQALTLLVDETRRFRLEADDAFGR